MLEGRSLPLSHGLSHLLTGSQPQASVVVRLCPVQRFVSKHYPLVPVNMTSFGNRAFASGVSLSISRGGHPGCRKRSPMADVPNKREEREMEVQRLRKSPSEDRG